MAKNKEQHAGSSATRDEVARAVDALLPADWKRLEKFAHYKVMAIGRKALGRSPGDLLHDAFTSTLVGCESTKQGRRWYKDQVWFAGHLFGAMRSTASHWKEAFDENEAHLDSELAIDAEDGEPSSPVERAKSEAPSQETAFLAKEKLGEIFRMFQNDDDAALVIEGMREGWTGPEIMSRLGIAKDKYEAAIKRIRYRLK